MPSLQRAGDGVVNYISPVTSQKVAQGKFFLAGTGRLQLVTAGNLRVTVENPANSGKIVSVVRLASMATATGWASIFLNPTAGLPAGDARPRLNAIAGGGLPAVAVMRVDTNPTTPLSGGIDTGLVLGIPGGVRTSLDLPPLVLAPGVVMGINVPFAGAADSSMSMYWFED